MTLSPPVSVLIIDRSQTWGSDLRERLALLGTHIHVVSSRAAALTFADAKKIDVAVLEFATDSWTRDLCAALKSRGVPYVYLAPQPQDTKSRPPAYASQVIELTESLLH